MAGSDDKPEDKGSEAGASEAKSPASKASRPRNQARKPSAAKDTKAGTRAKAGADADGSTEKDKAASPAKASPDIRKATLPEPVEAKDAPSGNTASAKASPEPSAPLKAGASAKGAETLADAARPETEAEEVPELSGRPEPEVATPPPAAASAPAPQKASAMPLILGGIIAGLIGFITAWYIWGRDGSAVELTARLDAQAETVNAIAASVSGKASSGDLAALEARLAAVESALPADTGATDATLAAQAGALATLTARIDALERAPVESSADPAAQAALAAYGREVEALRAEIAAQMTQMNDALEAAKETEAQAAARQEEAVAAAARAAEQGALLDVQQALDNGTPYDEALSRITSIAIPEALSARAAEGVMTLEALKDSFPAAARSALRVSREETAGADGGGLGSWITRQVGARSLEPKEGDDPDAVLSRAEAALAKGDLSAALEELAALPPAGQRPMDQWIANAKRRNDALAGAEALAAALTSN